jgi:hypothetical protein
MTSSDHEWGEYSSKFDLKIQNHSFKKYLIDQKSISHIECSLKY